MKRRLASLGLALLLAACGLGFLAGSLSQAAGPPLAPAPAQSPLLPPVGPGGETLLSPPVYRMVISETEKPIYVHNPLTVATTVTAELVAFRPAGAGSAPAAVTLSPMSQDVVTGGLGTFTLRLVEGWLPAGRYTGTVAISAAGLQPAQETFVVVVSAWPAELEWAQDSFSYVIDEGDPELTVWAVARHAEAQDVRLILPALEASAGTTTPFAAGDIVTASPAASLVQNERCGLTLRFVTERLPQPGTYRGTLELRAANAAPITSSLELIVPDARAPASYRLAFAELGESGAVSTSLSLTTALQFSGARWLPGTGEVQGSWWPVVVAALLLGGGTAALAAYAWWAGYRVLALVFAAAVAVGAVLWLIQPPAWGATAIPQRTLLVWEEQGRGPVRQLSIFGNGIVDERGSSGVIRVGEHETEIAAGGVLTVPVHVQGVSRPGVYAGRLVLQSPDIARGVVEVPVQVTVRDFILWPILVITLGVVAGGWVKYQQETVGQRLEKRKEIEQAWQEWNEYMTRDPYLYTSTARDRVNPVYEAVRRDLDFALELLDTEEEWGVENGAQVVTGIGQRLAVYRNLGRVLPALREELGGAGAAALDEVEAALRRGDLLEAAELTRGLLTLAIETLCSFIRDNTGDEAGKIKGDKATALQTSLTEAADLLEQGKFTAAWHKIGAVQSEIRRLGLSIPDLISPPTMRMKGPQQLLFSIRQALGLRQERYVIQPAFGAVRYRARENILLRLRHTGSPSDEPPASVRWLAQGKGKAEFDPQEEKPFDPRKGAMTRVQFYDEGRWVVAVEDNGGQEIASYSVHVKPSGLTTVYQDKRRHAFRRRLAALLVAVVVGLEANRIFDLTFGSTAAYLGAFAWGVTAGAGIDPAAGAYEALKGKLKEWFGTPAGGSGGADTGQD